MTSTTDNSIEMAIETRGRLVAAMQEALEYDMECEKQGVKPSRDKVRHFRDVIATAVRQTERVDLEVALRDIPKAKLMRLHQIVGDESKLIAQLQQRKTAYISGYILLPDTVQRLSKTIKRRYRVLFREFIA